MIKKLNSMVNDFEKTHPELTDTLGQMMDSLSRMGI
jgi:hypothetical protein